MESSFSSCQLPQPSPRAVFCVGPQVSDAAVSDHQGVFFTLSVLHTLLQEEPDRAAQCFVALLSARK